MYRAGDSDEKPPITSPIETQTLVCEHSGSHYVVTGEDFSKASTVAVSGATSYSSTDTNGIFLDPSYKRS